MSEKKNYTGLYISAFSAALWGYLEFLVPENPAEDIRKNLVEPLKVEDENEGKPVFVKGLLKTKEVLRDTDLKIKKNCLLINRIVSTYKQNEWIDGLDENSPIKNYQFVSNGPFELLPFKVNEDILDYIIPYLRLLPRSIIPEKVLLNFKRKRFAVVSDQESYYLSRFKRKQEYHPIDDDYKITYYAIPNRTYISVIGEQKNGFLVPYKNKYFLLKMGHATSEELISLVPDEESKTYIYGVRAFGLLGVLSGLFIQLKT